MIKYIVLTTGLATFTYLDGNINIYLAESSLQFTHENLIYDMECLIHSIFDLNGLSQQYFRIIRDNSPKLVEFCNINNLNPFFENQLDIVNSVGRRGNLFYYRFGFYFNNNVPIFLFPLVLSGIFIKKLLHIFVLKIKLHIDNSLLLKSKASYHLDNFFKLIYFNHVAPHFKNIKVFPAKSTRTKVTPFQHLNPVIQGHLARRTALATQINTDVLRIESSVRQAITVVQTNSLTLRRNPNGSLDIAAPANMVRATELSVRRNITALDARIPRFLDRITASIREVVEIEDILIGLGVEIQPRDFINSLQRARAALGRYIAVIQD